MEKVNIINMWLVKNHFDRLSIWFTANFFRAVIHRYNVNTKAFTMPNELWAAGATAEEALMNLGKKIDEIEASSKRIVHP